MNLIHSGQNWCFPLSQCSVFSRIEPFTKMNKRYGNFRNKEYKTKKAGNSLRLSKTMKYNTIEMLMIRSLNRRDDVFRKESLHLVFFDIIPHSLSFAINKMDDFTHFSIKLQCVMSTYCIWCNYFTSKEGMAIKVNKTEGINCSPKSDDIFHSKSEKRQIVVERIVLKSKGPKMNLTFWACAQINLNIYSKICIWWNELCFSVSFGWN